MVLRSCIKWAKFTEIWNPATVFLINYNSSNNPVLYSQYSRRWKIADFGFSVEGSSEREKFSEDARGTASYRAPELYDEPPSFTNKVDIWALGCILFELVAWRRAFPGPLGWPTREYHSASTSLVIPFKEELEDQVKEKILSIVQTTLDRHPANRPRAEELGTIFQGSLSNVAKRLGNANDLGDLINIHLGKAPKVGLTNH